LPARVRAARLQPPALIMIGEVIDADAALAALPQAVALTA